MMNEKPLSAAAPQLVITTENVLEPSPPPVTLPAPSTRSRVELPRFRLAIRGHRQLRFDCEDRRHGRTLPLPQDFGCSSFS